MVFAGFLFFTELLEALIKTGMTKGNSIKSY
jgi:hypothetical protein